MTILLQNHKLDVSLHQFEHRALPDDEVLAGEEVVQADPQLSHGCAQCHRSQVPASSS